MKTIKQVTAVLTAAFVVLVIASIANMYVCTDSILVDPILDSGNAFVQNTLEAENADVRVAEELVFRVTLKDVTRESLSFVVELKDEIKKFFPQADLFGAVSMENYAAPEGVDMSLSTHLLDTVSPQEILERISAKRYGRMLAYQDDDGWHMQITVLPPQDANEIDLYKAAHKLLYGRDIGVMELYFGTAMRWLHLLSEDRKLQTPQDVTVEVYGWSIWRTLINALTFSLVFSVLLVGIALPAIKIYRALGSWQQLAITVSGVACVTWCMRGSIAGLDLLTSWSFHEETYTILGYVPAIVLMYSYTLQTFKTFNALWHERERDNTAQERQAVWQQVRQDVSLKQAVGSVAFLFVADSAIFTLGQQWHGARSLFEVATLSIVTVAFILLPMVRYVVPNVHVLVGGIGKKPAGLAASRMARGILSWSDTRAASYGSIGIIAVLIIGASVWYVRGGLIVDSDPSAYITATPQGAVMTDLEKKGSLGAGLYKVFSAHFGDLNDPGTIERMARLATHVRSEDIMRALIVPTDILQDVLAGDFPTQCAKEDACLSREGLKRLVIALGEDESQWEAIATEILDAAWEKIALNPTAHYMFAHADNSVVFLATNVASRTSDMRSARDSLAAAVNNFCPVEGQSCAGAFGRLAQYPETDRMIVDGAAQTYIGSPIFVACMMWVILAFYKVQSSYRYHAWRGGVFVAITFAVSTAVTLIAMMTLKIPLDVATAAIGNVTIAAAADLPIFLFSRFAQEMKQCGNNFTQAFHSDAMADGVTRAGADVQINGLTYVPLAIPGLVVFPPIRDLGLMLIVALAACYAAAVFLSLPHMRWVYGVKR